MSKGFYLMYRGWMDNPVFEREPFTECQAWLWLIEEAAYKPTQKRIGQYVVNLERGQVAVSYRFLSKTWGWHKSRIERFTKRLRIGTMIGTVTGTPLSVISICNYDKYQVASKDDRDSSRDADRDKPRDKGRDNISKKKEKEVKEAPKRVAVEGHASDAKKLGDIVSLDDLKKLRERLG